jgi:exosortase H (IPTLxxWG-CTERM-specific)
VRRKKPAIKRKRAVDSFDLLNQSPRELDLSPNLKISPGFLLTFVVCACSLFAFSTWLPESAFNRLNENTARMAAHCLRLIGMHPVLSRLTLSQDGFAVSVVTECSTLYMAILLFSFVVAYPAALRQKLIGLPLGIPVLHAGNILRIAAIFAIGVESRNLFEIVHVYLGQILMVLFVLTVCLAWLGAGSEPVPRNRDLFAFVIRFFAFSSIPFLLWLPLNKEYVKLADLVVTGLFWLFHYQLRIPYQHTIYYQTFNVVTFTGLVLATRPPPLKRKLRMLAVGQAAIFVLHILFRVCNVLLTAFHNEPAEKIGVGITVCGQYILPVALWLLMVRNKTAAQKLPSNQTGKRETA